MTRFLFFIFTLWAMNTAHATSWADILTNKIEIGKWQIVEFAGSEQMIYRISSNSINTPETNIAFDFFPSIDCVSPTATLIIKLKYYSDDINGGLLIYEYKLPNQKKNIEIVKAVMSEDDTFAFFPFKELTVKNLLESKDKGKLAIWIPASGNGAVKKSNNMYFSLEGFSLAYSKAKTLCEEGK